MRVTVGGAPQEVNQGARHVLFVEGGPEGLDVTVLRALTDLRVEGLGASNFVESVARAMREFHPEYWFIRDRDDLDDAVVEQSWAAFPDPDRDNLLVWRRKELESYFLEPEWITRSRYFTAASSVAELQDWIAREASKTIWIEAAKMVFLGIRSQAKAEASARWSPADLVGMKRDQVEEHLVSLPCFAALAGPRSPRLDQDAVRRRFIEAADLLTGSHDPLEWRVGRWRDLISAKALYSTTVQRWFNVGAIPKAGTGPWQRIQGREAERLVALDLLTNHQDHMPSDLKELRTMLTQATARSSGLA